ncbi:MAG TPA: glycosyltransferase [Acetobacteraceae bacterium]|nr:glycosyltransferase [Acetobacteraceae bacterium]
MTVPRRRVAVVLNDMHSSGGIQRVAANLVRDLRRWYDTTLLSVEPLRKDPVFKTADLDFQSLNRVRRLPTRLGRITDFAISGYAMRRFVARNQIDTVLAIWYDWASVAAVMLPRGVKRIGCEHISFCEATRRMRMVRALCFPHLDCAVSLTDEDLPLLARISKQARTIPNYIAEATPAPFGQREKILLTVGHLESRKGLDRLLWALKAPLLAHPDWKLVVIGGGEKGHVDWGFMDYVSVLLQVLQLEGRVEFHPATRRINDWYRRASIYVMGSRREGLPMVLIEAKAHALPVIAFDCPTGPRDIIRDGVDGVLVDNDTDAFSAAAMSLMADPALRERMGQAAREDSQLRYSADTVLAQWRDLIESLHGNEAFLSLAPASELLAAR